MELMNQNQNGYFIQPGQRILPNNDVDQYFVEKDDPQSSQESNTFIINFFGYNILVLILAVFISVGIFSVLSTKFELYLKLIILSTGVTLLLLVLIFSSNKIILTKDTLNRKVVVKVMNYLFFPKMKLNLDIENTHFYILKQTTQSEKRKAKASYTLLIINDYKNFVDIDLDKSNIKNKPAKFFYSFGNIYRGNYGYKEYAEVLNNFIGSDGDYDNPLFFNADRYINRVENIYHI